MPCALLSSVRFCALPSSDCPTASLDLRRSDAAILGGTLEIDLRLVDRSDDS